MSLAERVLKALNIRSDENMYRNLELEKALAKVIEAAEYCNTQWCIKPECKCAICVALPELDQALKQCGV